MTAGRRGEGGGVATERIGAPGRPSPSPEFLSPRFSGSPFSGSPGFAATPAPAPAGSHEGARNRFSPSVFVT